MGLVFGAMTAGQAGAAAPDAVAAKESFNSVAFKLIATDYKQVSTDCIFN